MLTESQKGLFHSSFSRGTATERGAVALAFKRDFVRAASVDVEANLELKTYAKTKDEEEFLRSTMKEQFFFQKLSDQELGLLINTTEKVEVETRAIVFKEGDDGEYLYILQKGSMDMYRQETPDIFTPVVEGQILGELALLYGEKYDHSLQASESCVLWRLEQQAFRYILARQAHEDDGDMLAILSKIELFQGLNNTTLQKFASALTRVDFEEGDIIVKKGETGEVFYIIEQGVVRVHDIGIGDSYSVDQTLNAGDSFGERALLTGEPRAANCTALTDVRTLAMDRATFESHIGELHELIERTAKLQSLNGLPIFADADLSDVEFERLAELTVEKCYPKGTKLAEKGKPYALNVWIIRKGRLLIYGGRSGKIHNLENGDFFGDKLILKEENHISSHEAICEDNLTAWLLSRDDIESVIGDLSRLGKSAGFKRKGKKKIISSLRDVKKHKVLGQGGFGKVWLVQSLKTGEPYALKVMNKRTLLNAKQEKSIMREKDLLSLINHPFIAYNVSSFQDASFLYLVLPLIQGGELFSVVQAKGQQGLPNDDAAFYAAGIVEALGHFHHRYIAYRDLKLENVLIDADGYIKIIDLGFAKVVVDKTFTFCGTPEYLAPEIIMAKGHTYGVDYWSFGVLLFELLVGVSPFHDPRGTNMEMFKRIVLVDYKLPKQLQGNNAGDLVQKLLVRKVPDRLGMLSHRHYDIRDHPWFSESGCPYKKLLKKELTPPWRPNVKNPLDSSNFDDFSHLEREGRGGAPLSAEEQAAFEGF